MSDCEVLNVLLYVRNRLFVPTGEGDTLRTLVIKGIHESPPGGHTGRTSTYDRVSRHYYWPRMTDFIAKFVKSCHACRRSKNYRDGKQGLLKPLPIPETYWTDIPVDFIIPLSVGKRYGQSDSNTHYDTFSSYRLYRKRKFQVSEAASIKRSCLNRS